MKNVLLLLASVVCLSAGTCRASSHVHYHPYSVVEEEKEGCCHKICCCPCNMVKACCCCCCSDDKPRKVILQVPTHMYPPQQHYMGQQNYGIYNQAPIQQSGFRNPVPGIAKIAAKEVGKEVGIGIVKNILFPGL